MNILNVSTWWPNVVYFYQLPGVAHIQKMVVTRFWTLLFRGVYFEVFTTWRHGRVADIAEWPCGHK